jgi:hypothetical protein
MRYFDSTCGNRFCGPRPRDVDTFCDIRWPTVSHYDLERTVSYRVIETIEASQFILDVDDIRSRNGVDSDPARGRSDSRLIHHVSERSIRIQMMADSFHRCKPLAFPGTMVGE